MQSTNRLIQELSPYLLQHAHNPVDWYPWGLEAIEKARNEDKPIFLSIGYSACHWCHVMEQESFENPEIAGLLNEYYVSVKVDREERPDLDEIYMDAVQLIAGNGGWPMTVILDPELRPFFGGTYFPPESRNGRRGLKDILPALAALWENDRERLENATMEIFSGISQSMNNDVELTADNLKDCELRACDAHAAGYDSVNGGFGSAPKFPPSLQLLVMIDRDRRKQDGRYIEIIRKTLDGMACGGIHDHIGGGFCRYSVDEKWRVPHFEKMLTDNALLAQVYSRAFELTGDDLYRLVAVETLDYVLREMTDETGGFYSSQDADSEGREGKYYIWSMEEIRQILGESADLFIAFYNIQEAGNFKSAEDYHRGMNIPFTMSLRKPEGMDRSVALVLAERHLRIAPAIDDKIITSWNCLMIQAMAVGGRLTGERRFVDAAIRAAEFIENIMRKEKNLFRIFRRGVVRQEGMLDDWALWGIACMELFDATGDCVWLDRASEVARTIADLFHSEGRLYTTEADIPYNIVRKQSLWDSVIPSGASAMAQLLLRLWKERSREEDRTLLQLIMNAHGKILQRAPGAMCLLAGVAGQMVDSD